MALQDVLKLNLECVKIDEYVTESNAPAEIQDAMSKTLDILVKLTGEGMDELLRQRESDIEKEREFKPTIGGSIQVPKMRNDF